jgi:hypothetical protein
VATSPVFPIVRDVDETRLMDGLPVLERERPAKPSSLQRTARRHLLMLVVIGMVALVEVAWLAVITLAVFRIAHS